VLFLYVAASTAVAVVLPLLANVFDPLFNPKNDTDRIAVFGICVGILGLAAGTFAAIFSGRALHYIKEQIDLARKQITEAQKQTTLAQGALDLAKDEFAATIETLQISRRQEQHFQAQRAKVPVLGITFAPDGDAGIINDATYTRLSDTSPVKFSVHVLIENKGRSDATNTTVQVRTSKSLAIVAAQPVTPFIVQNREPYEVSFAAFSPIQNRRVNAHVAYINLSARWGEHELYCRAYSNELDDPKDGEGWMKLRVILPGGVDPHGQDIVKSHPLNDGKRPWP
jgi:hypothetical protein